MPYLKTVCALTIGKHGGHLMLVISVVPFLEDTQGHEDNSSYRDNWQRVWL